MKKKKAITAPNKSDLKKSFFPIIIPSISECNQLSLPKIRKNYQMNFFHWSTKDPLEINDYGIPEPISDIIKLPNILLVPLVAFDNNYNRIGYGGGFYDRYIKKLKKKKKIVTIGLAYSFQKVKKIPVTKYDIQLDFILTNTEKSKNQ